MVTFLIELYKENMQFGIVIVNGMLLKTFGPCLALATFGSVRYGCGIYSLW